MMAPSVFSTPMNSPRQFLIAASVIQAILLASALCLVIVFGATSGMSRYIFFQVGLGSYLAVLVALVLATALHRFATFPDWLWRTPPWLLASFVLVVTMVSTHLVHHGFAFSMDEWMQRLQAEIFLDGRAAAVLPEEWRPYARSMFHSFAQLDSENERVASSYRPGMAALIALFNMGNLGLYVSAFASAASIMLTASIAAKVAPGSRSAPILAALLMASSAQLLAAGMTSYAMSSQLLLNLLWLRLFLNDTTPGHLTAALVGVLTASLHQIHVHLFFALPLFALLIFRHRALPIVIYGVIYALGHMAILNWSPFGIPDSVAAAGYAPSNPIAGLGMTIKTLFALPDREAGATIAANLVRFLSWQSLALPPLLWLILRNSRLTPVSLALLASILFSLLPILFLMPDQGHGWGYRYLHGSIGSLVLIVVVGWEQIERHAGAKLSAVIGWFVLVTLLVVLPMRFLLMEKLVSPWQQGARIVADSTADIVIVDSLWLFYGQDIARTDPFAKERPIAMILHKMSPLQIETLCARYDVALFGREDAERVGIPVLPSIPYEFKELYERIDQSLQSDACRSVKGRLLP